MWFRMQHLQRLCLTVVLVALCPAIGISAPPEEDATDSSAAVATVNGRPIEASELEFLYLVRRVPDEQRAAVRERFIEELIDQRLIADFLASRRTEAASEELDARVAAVRQMIERGGHQPDEMFEKLGISDEMLRKTLALPLAWRQHVRRVVTERQLADYFAEHRARFDGTRRRISQIVITLGPEADEAARTAALDKLKSLQGDIQSGKSTFAEGARTHSQSPSKEQGGDMGWAAYGQRMPREISDVAFHLPPQTVSDPFLSRFGAHLLLVTEQEPGLLNLEDVRDEVLAEIGSGLWAEQLASERATAKITRDDAPPPEPPREE